MRRRLIFQGIAAAAVLGAALLAAAHEPDGRVAIRYDWLDAKEGESPEPTLRLTLTAVVDLSELELSAKVPNGIRLAVRAEDRAAAPWPDDGISIGALAAGRIDRHRARRRKAVVRGWDRRVRACRARQGRSDPRGGRRAGRLTRDPADPS